DNDNVELFSELHLRKTILQTSHGKTFSPQRHGDTEKSLRALRSVAEDGFLPFIRREIPIAAASFVIVAAGPVDGRRIAPIVHAYLEEGATRNFGADFYRAAISA